MKKEENKRRKGIFSRIIVSYCIGMITGLSVWAFGILQSTGYDASGILGVSAGVFGGELLLLCVKRILAKDRGNSEEEGTEGKEE